ncbi:hypothetical protein FH972_025473 [Carpinus fangiana]|uniref:Uncharacterized protein n=1 Tax=Carpinus fangiana TaxID=176857 RepID=A0A5N6L186_9ROSI|nr:hypothetical protein FH972_025473 [Carpinus fangiana]
MCFTYRRLKVLAVGSQCERKQESACKDCAIALLGGATDQSEFTQDRNNPSSYCVFLQAQRGPKRNKGHVDLETLNVNGR